MYKNILMRISNLSFFLVLGLCFVVSALQFAIFHKLPSHIEDMLKTSEVVTFTEDRDYLSAMDEVLASKRYVYAIYGRMRLVKVYDTNGNYICSIAVKDTKSGAHNMRGYIVDDKLHLVFDQQVYEFTDNVLTKTYTGKEASAWATDLFVNRAKYQNKLDGERNWYYLKAQSIYRTNANDPESVFLARSPLYLAFDRRAPIVLIALLFVVYLIPGNLLQKMK